MASMGNPAKKRRYEVIDDEEDLITGVLNGGDGFRKGRGRKIKSKKKLLEYIRNM
jgi:hypothetical protein